MLPAYASHIGTIAQKIRNELAGSQDAYGFVQQGDLERRLAKAGVYRDRPPAALSELSDLTAEDCAARQSALAFIDQRIRNGIDRATAAGEFIREAAYAWTNRLLALRCMQARGLIDAILVKNPSHTGPSPEHHRLARSAPEDDGLFTVLSDELKRQAAELPLVFGTSARELVLRPSPAALERCLAILSGTDCNSSSVPLERDMWRAPDALGWAYQHWHGEQKNRIFETLRTRKGEKISGSDLIPATCVYTQPYIVQFLVQNSLGAFWMGIHPRSRLCQDWQYYVAGADIPARRHKPVRDIRFLDPACGSGHFLLEAFDLFYEMYLEEGQITDPQEICAFILERNLYGIDIDERAVQVAALSLVMKAKEKARGFSPRCLNIVSTQRRLPDRRAQLEAFLRRHPQDTALQPALVPIFGALEHLDELGALVQIDWTGWKCDAIERLLDHFEQHAVATGPAAAFSGDAPGRQPSVLDLLGRRYDIVCMNPPYIGFRKLAPHIKQALASDDLATLDLYVAFLSRFFSLLEDGGSLAAVCPASWTTSSKTVALRRKMLCEGGPRIVAALGQRVFEPSPLLFVSLQIIARQPPRPDGYLVTLRPPPLSGADGLARTAQKAHRKWPHSILRSLETLPFLPIAPEELLEGAAQKPQVADLFSFSDGIWTGNNDRDIREAWEVRPEDTAWVVTSGGQGYARWYAPTSRRMRSRYARDWPTFAARSFALEYARVAGGKLSARLVTTPSAAIAGVVTLVPHEHEDRLRLFEVAAVFNCRLGTLWLRTLTSGLNFNPGYAGRIPLAPDPPPEQLARAVERVVAIKRALATRDITSDDFLPDLFQATAEPSFAAAARAFCNQSLDLIAGALEEEHRIELLLEQHLGLSAGAAAEIESELGAPAASLPAELVGGARDKPAAELSGPRDDAEDSSDVKARSLPAESDLEELSRAYGAHPRAILNAPERPSALAAAFDALCAKRRFAFVADLISLLVLRLVGHRFPSEAALGIPSAGSTGAAGILPLIALPGEHSLFDRLAGRIAQQSPADDSNTAFHEIAEVLGKPLDRWIESDLFRHHTTRFGKRPILWQIQSGKYSGSKKPALSVLVYALSLTENTLPAIRTQYLGPRRAALLAELCGIDASPPTAHDRKGRSRKMQIQSALEELEAFDARLAQVIQAGFSSPSLSTLAAGEPLDCWTSPDGQSRAPASHDELLHDEERYLPHPRDGVRLNIAPLQRAGLLAADVLAAKDVDRAIADRAEWRAAERKACRDGKLPKPDWWL